MSARHVHLSTQDWAALFGNEKIVIDRTISQPGQFVAKQRIALHGPKGSLEHVAVVGPCRLYTQCEVSQTDARLLGIKSPLSHSGKLEGAAVVTIVSPKGKIERAAAVVAHRHLHVTPKDAAELGFQNLQPVTLTLPGVRGVHLTNVIVRIHEKSKLCLHIDTDEGNACGFHEGMTASLSK